MKAEVSKQCLRFCFAIFLYTFPATSHATGAVEAWVQRYGSIGSARDQIRRIATDPAGNTVVVGSTDAGISGKDWLVIKYSNAGGPLWTNRYNGSGNGDDAAIAITIDNNGVAFVTGYSLGNGTLASQCTTIAYSSGGASLWTNHYQNRFGAATTPASIVTDRDGDLIIAASGQIDSFNRGGYETIKYSGAGLPLWTNVYLQPGRNSGEPKALAVDSSGNVVVTGSSSSSSDFLSPDYSTIKYSSSGVPLWTNYYNGPGNREDVAQAVAVDGNGTVFVTGYSYSTIYLGSSDYATIAYSSSGVPMWTNRYDGPANADDFASALVVDGSGNVIVVGESGIVNYSNAGLPVWTNTSASASAAVLDNSDDIIVTSPTIKYSNAGLPLWTNAEGIALAKDTNGSVFVVSYDFFTTAYSTAGVPLWTNRYEAAANAEDVPSAVALDAAGNVFVTGYSYGANLSYPDYATIKFSPSGVPIWTNYYDGANSDDRAVALVTDNSGNVVVTGISRGASSHYDFLTVSYSSAGLPLWTNRFNGPVNFDDRAAAIAVDNSGNFFVTGASAGTGDYDYTTIKYSNSGVPLWTNRYNGPGNSDDVPTAMAVDGGGNLLVTGYSYSSTTNGSSDYATIKYSNVGTPLWTNRYDGPANNVDHATAIAVDSAGDVIVTGYSYASTTSSSSSYATIKYSSAGLPLWTNRHQAAYTGSQAVAVALDSNGNVFVTGYSTILESPFYYTTIKYSNAGVPLRTNYYMGLGNDNVATALAVDTNGNVFVSGYSAGYGSSNDFATVAYSNDLIPLWTNRYNGPANGNDQPLTKNSLVLSSDGIVVIGQSDGSSAANSIHDYAVIKYVSVATVVGRPLLDGNDFVTRCSGMPGYTYTIEYEDALIPSHWQKLKNITAPAVDAGSGPGIFELREPIFPALRRFYRVVYPPY